MPPKDIPLFIGAGSLLWQFILQLPPCSVCLPSPCVLETGGDSCVLFSRWGWVWDVRFSGASLAGLAVLWIPQPTSHDYSLNKKSGITQCPRDTTEEFLQFSGNGRIISKLSCPHEERFKINIYFPNALKHKKTWVRKLTRQKNWVRRAEKVHLDSILHVQVFAVNCPGYILVGVNHRRYGPVPCSTLAAQSSLLKAPYDLAGHGITE